MKTYDRLRSIQNLFNSIDDEMFEYFMNFFKQFLIENK